MTRRAPRWAYELAGIPVPPRSDEEHQHQSAFFSWIDAAAARLPVLELAYAVPNGGHRSKATAGRLKAEGVRPGVPDVHLPVARRGHTGLWMEFKSATGRLAKEQVKRIKRLRDEGHFVSVVRDWERAKALVLWYIGESDEMPEV